MKRLFPVCKRRCQFGKIWRVGEEIANVQVYRPTICVCTHAALETGLKTDERHSVFVNGRSRPVVMEDMEKRINRGDIKAERAEAIKVMIRSQTPCRACTQNDYRPCAKLLQTERPRLALQAEIALQTSRHSMDHRNTYLLDLYTHYIQQVHLRRVSSCSHGHETQLLLPFLLSHHLEHLFVWWCK
jgi:hypothetical protein